MTTIHMARLETRNYTFEAFDSTFDGAYTALRAHLRGDRAGDGGTVGRWGL